MKITSKDLFAQVKKQHETTLAAAFKSGNPEQMAEAMTAFFDGMNEAVLQKAAEEIDARNQDAAILSARGANVLTADERAYYEGLAAALKASDPRAAVANYEVAMPQTVIERIIGTIKKTHPLLDKLNFVSPKRTGAYKKGWRCEIKRNGRGSTTATARNATNYQLTHLLEYPHKKRGHKGIVQPKKHIQPAADKWQAEFEHRCEEACKAK